MHFLVKNLINRQAFRRNNPKILPFSANLRPLLSTKTFIFKYDTRTYYKLWICICCLIEYSKQLDKRQQSQSNFRYRDLYKLFIF